MKIQVNSDNTVAVDASLTRFVKAEVLRVLGRFAPKVTRVEVHLSDIDKKKSGPSDKRCLVEVRPAGSDPRSASANNDKLAIAIDQALKKVQRSLTTFFGKQGWKPVEMTAPALPVRKAAAKKAAPTKKKARAKKPVGFEPPKKRVYRARREAWPKR
jgi:hypothetical protein